MKSEFVKYYDKIYSWKDYKKETRLIKKIIKKYKKSKGKELLDVACGTGNHITFLKGRFNCVGLDYDQDMLKIAREKNRDVEFVKGNMMNFKLYRKFDVVTCLFSSIAYLKNYNNLKKALTMFSNHMKPGAILIIEPFFTEKTFHSGVPHAVFVDESNLKIARINTSQRKGDMALLNFHYLIGNEKGVRHVVEKNLLGLFDMEKFLGLLRSTGFEPKFLERGLMEGRGLFIGIKH